MKRETRLNLIFIVLLVAVSIPGGVMLVKKKLKAGATSNMMPEAVHRETAYMDPLPLPGFIRHVPPKTIAWVAGLAGTTPRQDPLLSHQRTFEVVKISPEKQGWDATLLIWNLAVIGKHPLRSSLTANGQDVAGELMESKKLTLPAEVDNELRDVGFVNPPKQVLLAKFHYPVTAGEPTLLSVLGEPADLGQQQH